MSESSEELYQRFRGEIVPQHFSPGFIALSYVVSLIGAACTLELLNRRTSHKGIFNHLLLLGSAVSMGGIAIWCMHFIGNRAIDLGNGEPELQIAYSSSFTALSFFVPIIVLLAAFIAVGANNTVSWWRVTIGGVLAGAAICGMHYVGNNSIENYVVIYKAVNVVGAAIIAVAASIVSLALFFVFRASWTNAWWKRAACAVVLAGAVSGMHWCAATGTRYQLVNLSASNNELSRNTTVIVVICLSILACCIMAGVAIYTARIMRRYAHKAQQVVLAAAVFDKDGRILVNPDGLLPSEKITDSFIEKNASDTFSIAHPLFHWMFRASRNWSNISPLVGGMASHLSQFPRTSRDRDSAGAIKLIDEQGEMIADYDIVLRELFCVAAVGLAEKTKETLANVGQLWDDILPTGGGAARPDRELHSAGKDSLSESDLAEKGLQRRRHEYGRGSLMFLVRRVQNEREIARLEAAGYRFAELRQVSNIISSSMQIKCWDFEERMQTMAANADEENTLEPGVHLGFFGIRARVGSYGFDVLVRKNARNLLPSMQLPIARLETWHQEFLQQLNGMSASNLSRRLDALRRLSSRESVFTTQLFDALESLREWIDPSVFDEAILSSKVVTLPTRTERADQQATSMLVLRLVIPIHVQITNNKCELMPLNFFKVRQVVGCEGVHQLAFAQSLHRDFAPIAQTVSAEKKPAMIEDGKRSSFRGSPIPSRIRRFARHNHTPRRAVDGEGNPIPTTVGRPDSITNSNDTGSTLKLWPGRRNSDNRSANSSMEAPPLYNANELHQQTSSFGGIMVSEEIRVEITEAGPLPSPPAVLAGASARAPAIQAPRRTEHVTPQKAGATSVHEDYSRGAPIELRALAASGGNVHTGAEALVSNVEAEKADEPTFVDELFAICIDGR